LRRLGFTQGCVFEKSLRRQRMTGFLRIYEMELSQMIDHNIYPGQE
jgi:hypothetical protein